MSNYSKTTDFAAKDSLPSGDSGKIIRGSEFETEFDNISTAIATKADAASPTFTGTVTIDGLTVNGNTVLGNAATDTVTVTADIASNLIPSADDTYNLGASGAEWNDLHVDGVAYIDTINGFAATGNVNFGDNNKAQFGAGNDLQIFHSSSSFIRELGSGGLYLDSDGGHVTIRVNSSEKAVEALNNGAVNLYHDNAQKLATTSTGIDVAGDVTASGLTVESAANTTIRISDSTSVNQRLDFEHNAGVSKIISSNNGAYGSLQIQSFNGTSTVDRLRIKSSGDIEFYEDTGTTAKFFWDASAESLGIGTASPASASTLTVNNDSNGQVLLGRQGATQAGKMAWPLITAEGDGDLGANQFSANEVYGFWFQNTGISNPASEALGFRTNGVERMRIDSTGNVGIGVSAPAEALDVDGRVLISQGGGSGGTPNADAKELVIDGTGTTGISILAVDDPVIRFGNVADGSSSIIRYDTSADVFQCGSTKPAAEFALLSGNGSEAARINSNGNLLVGKTTTGSTNIGTQLSGDGYASIVATSTNIPLYLQNKAVGGNCRISFTNDSHGGASLGLNDNGDFTIFDSTASTTRFTATSDKVLTASGGLAGIELGGSGAANTLDDYEEGTWTCVLSDGTNTVTLANGTYTKIGRTVTCVVSDFNEDTSSLSGNVKITGLPFTSSGKDQGVPLYYRDGGTAGNSIIGFIGNSSSEMSIRENRGSAATAVNVSAASNTTIFSTFTYQTA